MHHALTVEKHTEPLANPWAIFLSERPSKWLTQFFSPGLTGGLKDPTNQPFTQFGSNAYL